MTRSPATAAQKVLEINIKHWTAYWASVSDTEVSAGGGECLLLGLRPPSSRRSPLLEAILFPLVEQVLRDSPAAKWSARLCLLLGVSCWRVSCTGTGPAQAGLVCCCAATLQARGSHRLCAAQVDDFWTAVPLRPKSGQPLQLDLARAKHLALFNAYSTAHS